MYFSTIQHSQKHHVYTHNMHVCAEIYMNSQYEIEMGCAHVWPAVLELAASVRKRRCAFICRVVLHCLFSL